MCSIFEIKLNVPLGLHSIEYVVNQRYPVEKLGIHCARAHLVSLPGL